MDEEQPPQFEELFPAEQAFPAEDGQGDEGPGGEGPGEGPGGEGPGAEEPEQEPEQEPYQQQEPEQQQYQQPEQQEQQQVQQDEPEEDPFAQQDDPFAQQDDPFAQKGDPFASEDELEPEDPFSPQDEPAQNDEGPGGEGGEGGGEGGDEGPGEDVEEDDEPGDEAGAEPAAAAEAEEDQEEEDEPAAAAAAAAEDNVEYEDQVGAAAEDDAASDDEAGAGGVDDQKNDAPGEGGGDAGVGEVYNGGAAPVSSQSTIVAYQQPMQSSIPAQGFGSMGPMGSMPMGSVAPGPVKVVRNLKTWVSSILANLLLFIAIGNDQWSINGNACCGFDVVYNCNNPTVFSEDYSVACSDDSELDAEYIDGDCPSSSATVTLALLIFALIAGILGSAIMFPYWQAPCLQEAWKYCGGQKAPSNFFFMAFFLSGMSVVSWCVADHFCISGSYELGSSMWIVIASLCMFLIIGGLQRQGDIPDLF